MVVSDCVNNKLTFVWQMGPTCGGSTGPSALSTCLADKGQVLREMDLSIVGMNCATCINEAKDFIAVELNLLGKLLQGVLELLGVGRHGGELGILGNLFIKFFNDVMRIGEEGAVDGAALAFFFFFFCLVSVLALAQSEK